MRAPLVTYPAGSTRERSEVLAVQSTPQGLLFVVERTPCHPESPRWPDQPADRCTAQLLTDGEPVPIECLEGHLAADGTIGLDAAQPQDEQALRCVIHSAPAGLALTVGEQVTLQVDETLRAALSRSHTRCHLVSLALNRALADCWRKDPGRHDSLGSPDFDSLAIQSSTIHPDSSLDVYRIGKSLRKTGFEVETLEDTQALAERVKQIAEAWMASCPTASLDPGESTLEQRRTWSLPLPEGIASFPCGGTHIAEVQPEPGLTVEIAWEPEARRLAMRAHA